MNKWRNRLSPRSVSRRAMVRRAGVVLAVLAMAIVEVLPSTTAHAQTKVIDMIVNWGDQMILRGTADHGASWSAWSFVGRNSSTDLFSGRLAMVSDRPGHLVAMGIPRGLAHGGYLGWYEFTAGVGWTEFFRIRNNGVSIGGRRYFWQGDPAVASWGPGRFDVFVHAVREGDGVIALLHSWANNNTWTGRWEVLGTGTMQGSPAAVSWGPNRIDVFSRTGDNGIAQKTWNGSSWSGWMDRGGPVTSDPGVASSFPGQLQLFALVNGGLWTREYDGGWTGWGFVGFGNYIGFPAVASKGGASMEVFVRKPDHTMDQWSYQWPADTWLVRTVPGRPGEFFDKTHATAVYWQP